MPSHAHTPDNAIAGRHRLSPGVAVVQIALVLVVFALLTSWPAPDVNEAHYLGKARHRWQPDFAPGDFFFDSPDGHPVFGLAIGPLSYLPGELFVWGARLLVWTLQAWGFCRLWNSVSQQVWFAPLAAAWFVLLAERFEMAGEWAIGGAEAKGVAYALVFFGLASLGGGRWNAAWCWFGAASSFHVLVGGWSVVAVAVAWVLLGRQRAGLRAMLPGLALGTALSLPGLISALALTWSSNAAQVREANLIYVYGRLAHHLDPGSFPRSDVLRFAALASVWLVAATFAPRAWLPAVLRWFVTSTLLISAAGWCLSLALAARPDWHAALMKFYWFRMSDVMVPLGVALLGCSALAAAPNLLPAIVRRVAVAAAILVAVAFSAHRVWVEATLAAPRSYRGLTTVTERTRAQQYADWRAACDWIAANTPTDALFLTPQMESTFKWYAGRGEVATWKDVPQDAPSLIEWRRRLVAVYRDKSGPRRRWRDTLTEVPAERLRELAGEFGATHLLVEAEPRLALDLEYQNNSYAVYRLEP